MVRNCPLTACVDSIGVDPVAAKCYKFAATCELILVRERNGRRQYCDDNLAPTAIGRTYYKFTRGCRVMFNIFCLFVLHIRIAKIIRENAKFNGKFLFRYHSAITSKSEVLSS